MSKSATDVMHAILLTATLDAVAAIKASAKGLPNTLVREMNAINANATFEDLSVELQSAVNASVRAAFTQLLKEGYVVTSSAMAPREQPARPADARPLRPGALRSDRPADKRPHRPRNPNGSRPKPPGPKPKG